eukprot:g55564.t1
MLLILLSQILPLPAEALWHLAPAGASVCDYGQPVAAVECEAAVASLADAAGTAPGRALQTGSGGTCGDGAWGSAPVGCSAQSGGDWAAHYKASGVQCASNVYQIVCTGATVAQEDCNAAMTLNLPTATQTDPAVGSVEGMQLRVTGDWNTVLAVKGARPLVDGEVFGLTPLKNEQVGLGVSINGDKPQGLRFNDETWGWYLDAETVQWGSEEQRLQFKRQAGDADPALRMTVDSARNQATFWPPDSAALTYDLPAHFRGKALYPVFQVWNSNQAVAVFQSSCSLICGYSPLTLNLATATQTNPAVGSVEGMQLRVTGDWNTVLAVKGARPLVDGEVFGLTPLKNEQVGLGVSINGDKPQGLRFNDETWGWYLDAETVQWGSEEQRLQFKRQAGDADPALRMTVDSAHNQATFWPPDSAALTYDLPAHFSGKALYPVLQVWNSNQAVFQSSCKNLLHTQSSSAFTSQVSREFKLERKSRLALILGILGGLCCLCTLLMLFTRRSSEATARQPSQHTVQPALEPRPQRLTDAELIATYREAQAKFTSSPFHVPTGTVVTSKPFYASAAVAVDEAADGDLVRMWSSEAEAVGLEGQVQGLGLGREHETDEGQVGTETFEQQPGLH